MPRVNLDRILKRKKLSRRKFARLIGIDYKNVSRMFRPTFDPRLSSLASYAKRLGVRVRDLIEE